MIPEDQTHMIGDCGRDIIDGEVERGGSEREREQERKGEET